MIYLLGSILCSSFLFIIFKSFGKFKIDLLQAIVVNYIVAGALGFALAQYYNVFRSFNYIYQCDWFVHALLIGLMFISIFTLMGICSQKVGVSITSVANKMSVVIPVMFGLFFLSDAVTFFKISGIVLSIVALFLTTSNGKAQVNGNLLVLPLIIFFASGVLDIFLSYTSKYLVKQDDTIVFTATLFSLAAILGTCWLLIKIVIQKNKIQLKNIFAGIILGIPNFASILFVFLGLKATNLDVSVYYPILNIGIVVLTSIFGLLFFKEKLSPINIIGIILAVGAISLISFL